MFLSANTAIKTPAIIVITTVISHRKPVSIHFKYDAAFNLGVQEASCVFVALGKSRDLDILRSYQLYLCQI